MLIKYPTIQFAKFSAGAITAKVITNFWSNEMGQKVYLFGKRVHHGFIGLLLIIVGFLLKIFIVVGFGFQLLFDDIDDRSEWLDFENGGNSDKIISYS